MNKNNVNKFQFIMVDEKYVNIKYDGVENKGPRPYMVIRTGIKQGYFLACPFTTINNEKGFKKDKGYYWITYKLQKESYIKLDHLILFKNDSIGNGVETIDKHLDANLKKLVINKLHSFIDYEE